MGREDDDQVFEEAMRGLGLDERGARAGRDDASGEMAALMAEVDAGAEPPPERGERDGGRVRTQRSGPDLAAEDEAFLQAMGALAPPAMPEPPEEPRPAPRPVISGSRRTLSRRIKVGTINEERVLDLHRMTRDAASERLRTFLTAARRDGVRVVKVITGRGLHSVGEAVLQEAVADWLKRELRSLIQEVVKAPRGRGGEGATYVFLRPSAG